MQRFALLFIALILVFTFVPAYYPPNDEALRQNSSLCDIHSHLFTAAGAFYDFNHNHGGTGVSVSVVISYRLPQNIPSSIETRGPPRSRHSFFQLP